MEDISRGVRSFTVGTAVSRVMGLVREMVIARLFGAGFAVDAYNVAFRIPNLLRDLFAETALSAAFVPVLTAEKAKGKEAQNRLASNIFNILFVTAGAVSLAGLLLAPPLTPVDQITEAEWDRVLAVNLKGAFLFCQAVMPILRRQRSGKIINISSSAAQTGGLIASLHYSASKAGLIGMTKSLARLLAPDVQVNAVAPGMIDTEMTQAYDETVKANVVRGMPLHRLGTAEDVAWAVLYLASNASDFMTGQVLAVSGGLYMA